MGPLAAEVIRRAVEAALAEDLGEQGDVTTEAVVPAGRRAMGRLIARADLVVAGLPLCRAVFAALDPALEFVAFHEDGDRVSAGTPLAEVRGAARPILEGERTALNFLGRLSGIATATQAATAEIAGTRARILDTRKTAPGLRVLDKYAVALGGGVNHRMGLYDAVLIKDTHLGAGSTIAEAVRQARAAGHPAERITVEVRDAAELGEAIAAGAGRALLDNMSVAALGEAVRLAAGRIVLEASGGLRPGRLREIAQSGVDFLSVGWLTHSAPAADVALETEVLP